MISRGHAIANSRPLANRDSSGIEKPARRRDKRILDLDSRNARGSRIDCGRARIRQHAIEAAPSRRHELLRCNIDNVLRRIARLTHIGSAKADMCQSRMINVLAISDALHRADLTRVCLQNTDARKIFIARARQR